MCPWPRIQAALIDQRHADGHLSPRSRRAARAAQEGPAVGGARPLHRLQSVRRRLPDGDRHPRRRSARVHQLRAVHRRLQRRDEARRPAARADRLRHARQYRSGARRARSRAFACSARASSFMRRRSSLVGGVMLFGLSTRATIDLNVLRDRNPTFVRLSDGSVRNAYTVKVMNRSNAPRDLQPVDRRASGASRSRSSASKQRHCRSAIAVEADRLRTLRVLVDGSGGTR